ncbi:MAG: hypothetical protein QNK11_00485 [Legionella sp.]|nr:hypothetical protein [Legionella sp.]
MPQDKPQLQYTFSFSDDDSGYDSSYEDNGIKFIPDGKIGEGVYAQARLFRSVTPTDIKTVKSPRKVVLSPSSVDDIDKVEINTKYKFYKLFYPESDPQLVWEEGTYRLILNEVPGKPYDKLDYTNEIGATKIFLATARALIDAHDNKKHAFLDLKEDNVHYESDDEIGKSFLLDGGLIAKLGLDYISEVSFRCACDAEVEEFRREYDHVPPECFSTSPVIATREMDIYALGSMMKRRLNGLEHRFSPLLEQCLDKNPKNRPSLKALEWQLTVLLKHLRLGKTTNEDLNTLREQISTMPNASYSSFTYKLSQLEFIINLGEYSQAASRDKFITGLLSGLESLDSNTQRSALEALRSTSYLIEKQDVQATIMRWFRNELSDSVASELPQSTWFSWFCGAPETPDIHGERVLLVLPVIFPYLHFENKNCIYDWATDFNRHLIAKKILGMLELDMVPENASRLKTGTRVSEEILDKLSYEKNDPMLRILISNAFSALNRQDDCQLDLNLLCMLLVKNYKLYELIKNHAKENPSDTVGRCQLNFFMDTYASAYKMRPVSPYENDALVSAPEI